MSVIGHNGEQDDKFHVGNEIDRMRNILEFVSFTTGTMGYYGYAGDMSVAAFNGIAEILDGMRNDLGKVGINVEQQAQRIEDSLFRKAGLPEHALSDENHRRAWGSGYSAGVNSNKKESE